LCAADIRAHLGDSTAQTSTWPWSVHPAPTGSMRPHGSCGRRAWSISWEA
jgi:hypothetical protein